MKSATAELVGSAAPVEEVARPHGVDDRVLAASIEHLTGLGLRAAEALVRGGGDHYSRVP